MAGLEKSVCAHFKRGEEKCNQHQTLIGKMEWAATNNNKYTDRHEQKCKQCYRTNSMENIMFWISCWSNFFCCYFSLMAASNRLLVPNILLSVAVAFAYGQRIDASKLSAGNIFLQFPLLLAWQRHLFVRRFFPPFTFCARSIAGRLNFCSFFIIALVHASRR